MRVATARVASRRGSSMRILRSPIQDASSNASGTRVTGISFGAVTEELSVHLAVEQQTAEQ